MGIADDFVRGSLLHNTPVIHHKHAVSELLNQRNIVADKENGETLTLLYPERIQKFDNLLLNGYIQSGGSFVTDDEFGFNGQGSGNCGPLALATTDLVGVAAGEFRGKAALLKQLPYPFPVSFRETPALRKLSPMLSPRVRRGSKESVGVWKTICMVL